MSQQEFVMPSNPEQLKAISDAVVEAANSKLRASSESSLQKEIAKRMKEEFGMSPSMFRKMVKVYYKSNFSEEVTAAEEFEQSYITIMGDKDPTVHVDN